MPGSTTPVVSVKRGKACVFVSDIVSPWSSVVARWETNGAEAAYPNL